MLRFERAILFLLETSPYRDNRIPPRNDECFKLRTLEIG